MNWFKNHYEELMNAHSSPKSVASGFAAGTFLAILPTPGVGLLLALFVAFLFPKISKLSMFIALAVFNPFVLTPIYAMSYKLGDSILTGYSVKAIELFAGNSLYHLTLRLLTGSIIIATLTSTLMYFIVYFLVLSRRKK